MKKQLFLAATACLFVIETTFGQTTCINVKDAPYNAVGNGVTNDYSAIQSALNAGKCIFFPDGTYNIGSSTLDIGSPKTLLFETNNAVLKYTGSSSAVKIGNEKFVTWHRGRIDITGAGNNAIGLHIKGLWNSDFYRIAVDRKSSGSQVGIQIETNDGGSWGAYILNFYEPIINVGTGQAAIKTMRTSGDNVDVTHLNVYGGWVSGGTNLFEIDRTAASLFQNIASEVTDSNVYRIWNSNDIIVMPGELPASPTGYHFKLASTSAISILTSSLSTTNDLKINGDRPSIISRSGVELYGSRGDYSFYTRLISQYDYNSQTKLIAKGGGNEVTILEWADAAGLTLRGGVGGIKLGGGAGISKHLSATQSWDPPSIIGGSYATTTISVSDAAVGETVVSAFSQNAPGAILTAAVTSSGVVTVTLFNATFGSINLSQGTLRVDVWKH